MVHIEHFSFNAFQTRCCAVWDKDGFCAFVDPGCSSSAEVAELTGLVSSRGLKPVCIMLTHAHFDHIYGVTELSALYGGLPVYMHAGEIFSIENTNPYVCKAYGLPLPDTSFIKSATNVVDGDVISVGELRFEVIETPGHSRNGLCFFERTERILFSGDTLFAGAIGRTDHPGGDYDALMRSIFEKLLPLDEPADKSSGPAGTEHTSISVIPGHGPCTDLTTEGMSNPFLLPFNEPYED